MRAHVKNLFNEVSLILVPESNEDRKFIQDVMRKFPDGGRIPLVAKIIVDDTLGLESTVIKEINYDSKTYKEKDSNS